MNASRAREYLQKVRELLNTIEETQTEAIARAAELIADSIANDGILYVFGCGHSQMYAEELFYRAGGLVPVYAMLEPPLSLRPEASKSTWFERLPDYGKMIFEKSGITRKDVLLIASTSGRNNVPIDLALSAKEAGVKVIALTSTRFSESVSSRHPSGKLLKDIADIVLDNCVESGDAAIQVEGVPTKVAATSTVAGCAILQAVVAQVVENLVGKGIQPPVWVSSNLDGGDEINAQNLKKYGPRIKIL